jgi:hypothetical protein
MQLIVLCLLINIVIKSSNNIKMKKLTLQETLGEIMNERIHLIYLLPIPVKNIKDTTSAHQ